MTLTRGRRLVELNVFAEICCDLCNEVIHNHIDCPACGKKYAETDHYGTLVEYGYPGEDVRQSESLMCEECQATFILKSRGWYADPIVMLKDACFLQSQNLTEW